MLIRMTMALAGLALCAQPAVAQQFANGDLHIGPRIWLGNLNGALAVGGQIEKAFTAAGDVGPGIIGLGAGVDFYGYSQSFDGLGGGKWSYSFVPVQVFGNYHFVIDKNRKIDPYVGLALVHGIASASWDGPGTAPVGASASYTVFAGQGGIRYFLSERMALHGHIGFGYGTLGAGASFKL
jgi:hypothetical protein